MNNIKVITKLYELIELVGENQSFSILERVIEDIKKRISEDIAQERI